MDEMKLDTLERACRIKSVSRRIARGNHLPDARPGPGTLPGVLAIGQRVLIPYTTGRDLGRSKTPDIEDHRAVVASSARLSRIRHRCQHP